MKWTNCPKCKKGDKTLYGTIGWEKYYKPKKMVNKNKSSEKTCLYICNRCNIGYEQDGTIIKPLCDDS